MVITSVSEATRCLNRKIKAIIKLVVFRAERKRYLREIAIRKEQDKRIRSNYDPSGQKLIVFAIPGADLITGEGFMSGGIISAVSLCEESGKLVNAHGSQTIMCTLPGLHLFLNYNRFRNETDVFRFSQLEEYFLRIEDIVIHLPECLCEYFLNLPTCEIAWLTKAKYLHINILNQNILLMPNVGIIERLQSISSRVTCTTAHQRYCTLSFREQYGVPLHRLSVWMSPEQYEAKCYSEKENLLVISPDPHPLKGFILAQLACLNWLGIQVIQDLSYDDYKEVIGRAKWALTFGEGLDGYFIEPVFSGGVSFSVYNDDFFTTDFCGLPGLYPNYDLMLNNIVSDIEMLSCSPHLYQEWHQLQFELCSRHYNSETYRDNIRKFYLGQYTFP